MTTKSKTTPTSQATRIKELEAELERLNQNKGELEEEKRIPLEDLITVMSLVPYPLNLSTQEFGRGKNVRFESFGQVRKVLYKDLLDILDLHRNFMENGFFIILDERVIKSHGLQEIYDKLLIKENFDKILTGSKGAVQLYKTANVEQQKVILTMVIEKLRDNPEAIDLNLVDQLSRISGINIGEAANEARAFFNVSQAAV